MTDTPLVSVLMPVYNSEQFLPPALDCVLAQTFVDYELVAVDDGSTDGSVAILERYAAADPRIRIHRRQTNGGIVAALTDGFRLVRGDVVSRLDADDLYDPTLIDKEFAFLRSHPSHVAVGVQAVLVDGDGRELSRPTIPTSHDALDAWHMSGRGNLLYHSSIMFRRSAFERVGGYRSGYELAEDFDLWLRMAEAGRLTVLTDRLFTYRIHTQSLSRQRARAQDRAIWRALRDAVRRRGYPLAQVPFDDLGTDEQVNWIELALAVGNVRQARRWAWRRVRRTRNRAAVKQWGKTVLGGAGWAVRLYDRLRGRPPRQPAFDASGGAPGASPRPAARHSGGAE